MSLTVMPEDFLIGDTGTDTIHGGADDDLDLRQCPATMILYGDTGNDTIYGG